MNVGRSYRISEFVRWTRRKIYLLLFAGCVPVVAYQLLGWKWVAVPWTVVALLGTAAVFIVGFRNTHTAILVSFFIELEKGIKELYDLQGRSERIKNFPYPRQYAVINTLFVRIFCVLLPFGMLREFDVLGKIWLVVPFSALVSWMYLSLEQVGESTENPFEGGANDVPIAQICRMIEVEARELLGETHLPPVLRPRKDIIL